VGAEGKSGLKHGRSDFENKPESKWESNSKALFRFQSPVLSVGMTRVVNVGSEKRRILYIEGEPRWEFAATPAVPLG